MRVTLLYDVVEEEDEGPKADAPVYKEVARCLEQRGHEVETIVTDRNIRGLVTALEKDQCDMVFNLCESLAGVDRKAIQVASLLELLEKPFTGAGSLGMMLAHDKALAKKIFSFHGLATPRWAVVWRGRLDSAHDIDFPVIVKPAREDGSIGIGFDALVGSIKELMERIDQLHAEFDHPVLIEQYIEGREIYMGVLGNHQAQALPAIELDLSHLPKGTPRIAGSEVKWAEGTRAYRGSKVLVPKLPDDVQETMQRAALTAFHALSLRDYARVDFRLTRDGTVYLIEANPNPYLSSGAEFIKGARASGRTYGQTILEIVELARARYAAIPAAR